MINEALLGEQPDKDKEPTVVKLGMLANNDPSAGFVLAAGHYIFHFVCLLVMAFSVYHPTTAMYCFSTADPKSMVKTEVSEFSTIIN